MGNKQNEIQTGFELNIIITGNLDFEKMRILFNYNNLQKTTKSFKNITYEEPIINSLGWIIIILSQIIQMKKQMICYKNYLKKI